MLLVVDTGVDVVVFGDTRSLFRVRQQFKVF